MKFEHHKNKLMRPFIVYCDTESTLLKCCDAGKTETFQRLSKHVVNSCCYYFVCTFDSSRNVLRTFDGDSCLIDMVRELQELSAKCIEEMRLNEQMKLNKADKLNFKNATCYSICKGEFDPDCKKLLRFETTTAEQDNIVGSPRKV